MTGRDAVTAVIRRILSLAKLRPVEAFGAIAAGIGLWVLAVVTPRPDWAPDWSGWALTILGWVILGRGIVGLFGLVDVVHGILSPKGWPGNRTPRNDSEVDDLLAGSPRRPGWEYYLTAAYLALGRERVEPQYLDHQLHFRPPVTQRVADTEVKEYFQGALADIQRTVDNANAIFGSDLQTRAFGPPGTPGDPTAIKHLTDRMTGFYVELLDWASRLRGVAIHSDIHHLRDLTTRLVDDSVEAYRAWVDEFVSEVDGPITRAIKTRGAHTANVILTISINDETLDAISAEIERLIRNGW